MVTTPTGAWQSSSDPFAPVKRMLWISPLLTAAGAAIAYLGASHGDALPLVAGAFGALLALFGLARLLGAAAVLSIERRRAKALREGEPSTATVKVVRDLGSKAGYPIRELVLVVRAPDGSEHTVKRRGAIPPQFAGSLEPGFELPIRVRASDLAFAVDWDGL